MMREIALEAYNLHTTGEYVYNNIAGIFPRELDPTHLLLAYAMFWGQQSHASAYDSEVKTAMEGRGCGSTLVWKTLTFEHPSRFDTAVEKAVKALYNKYRWDLLTKENLIYGDKSSIEEEDLQTLRKFYRMDEACSSGLTACAYDWFFGHGEEVDHVRCAHECEINSIDEYIALMRGVCAFWVGTDKVCATGLNYCIAFEALVNGRTDTARRYVQNMSVLGKFADVFLAEHDRENFWSGYNFVPTRLIKALNRLRETARKLPFYMLVPGAKVEQIAPCLRWDMEDYYSPHPIRVMLHAWANAMIAGREYTPMIPEGARVSRHDVEQIAKSICYDYAVNDCMFGSLAIKCLGTNLAPYGHDYWCKMKLDDPEESYDFLAEYV